MESKTKAGSKALPGQDHNPGLETMTTFFSIETLSVEKRNHVSLE